MKFSEVVKKALQDKGLDVKDLAAETGISITYLYELLRGEKRWNEQSISKVCEALVISIHFDIIQK